MIGPAGMPAPVVERINREIMAIVGTPDGRVRLLDLGAEVVGGTPAESAAFLRQDLTPDGGADPGRQHQGGVGTWIAA